MADKSRRLTCFGTFIFFSGILLVIGTLLTWLLAPLLPPLNFESYPDGDLTNLEAALQDAGPALSPYYPDPTAQSVEQAFQLVPAQGSEPAQNNEPAQAGKLALQTNHDWRTASFPDGNRDKPTQSTFSEQQMSVSIPALNINAPILPATLSEPDTSGARQYQQWSVPDEYAAGWHNTSARPGQSGNVVLNGHNNIHGAIFHDLVDLPLGAEIILTDGGQSFTYHVTGRQFLLEQGEPLRNRMKNARWIMPTNDERITIVTCWPNTSNSYRLVVVAHPAKSS